MMDEDEWAETVAWCAEEWFTKNGVPMENHIQDQEQVTEIQASLSRFRLTPELNPYMTKEKFTIPIKEAIFYALDTWASRRFEEICPECEKSSIYLDIEDKQPIYLCRKDCGWSAKNKQGIIRRDR